MEPLLSLDPDALVERRASRRTRVVCDAVLETLTGRYAGKLWDISEHGARLQLPLAPEAGATARLRWEDHEAICRVVWGEEDMCGISFDSPLVEAIVAQTAERNRVVDLPIARVGNIALGRKRSLSLVPPAVAEPATTPEPEMARSQWIVAFPGGRHCPIAGDVDALPAAQAMFFYGAPLSHVVAFQAWAHRSGA